MLVDYFDLPLIETKVIRIQWIVFVKITVNMNRSKMCFFRRSCLVQSTVENILKIQSLNKLLVQKAVLLFDKKNKKIKKCHLSEG